MKIMDEAKIEAASTQGRAAGGQGAGGAPS
jgi:hypothetical protein